MSAPTEQAAWCRLYRAALLALPRALREKHGDAMVALYARDLDRAGSAWERATITISAIADVLRRAPYEWLHGATGARVALDGSEADASRPTVRARDLVQQLRVPFGIAFAVSTGLMIALYVQRSRFDVSPVEQFLLSLPYMCVLTIPLALCVAVAWVSRRIRRASDTFMPSGLQRSVLLVSSGVAAFTLLLAAEIVPRTNARLVNIRTGQVLPRSDRAMTLGELHRAARTLEVRTRATTNVTSIHAYRVQIAALDVEYHKKLVLAASCIVLALVGLALGWYMARLHAAVVVLSSLGVFVLFVVSIMAGESMADRLTVSPAFAMWAGTELLVYAVLFNAAAQRSAARRIG